MGRIPLLGALPFPFAADRRHVGSEPDWIGVIFVVPSRGTSGLPGLFVGFMAGAVVDEVIKGVNFSINVPPKDGHEVICGWSARPAGFADGLLDDFELHSSKQKSFDGAAYLRVHPADVRFVEVSGLVKAFYRRKFRRIRCGLARARAHAHATSTTSTTSWLFGWLLVGFWVRVECVTSLLVECRKIFAVHC